MMMKARNSLARLESLYVSLIVVFAVQFGLFVWFSHEKLSIKCGRDVKMRKVSFNKKVHESRGEYENKLFRSEELKTMYRQLYKLPFILSL